MLGFEKFVDRPCRLGWVFRIYFESAVSKRSGLGPVGGSEISINCLVRRTTVESKALNPKP